MKLFAHSLVSRLACALGLATLLCSVDSHATSLNNVLITDLTVDNSGNAYVRTASTVSGTSPGCILAGNNKGYSFVASTAAGKNLLSLLTAAMLANRTVFLQGMGSTDTCTVTSAGAFENLATARILP